LHFCSPYGCSKGGADQYVLDYFASYGLPTVVFRMSCIYGPHQCGNEDQGWVAHFLMRAMAGEAITIYGDGCQVRDILFVDDLVSAMLLALDRIDDLSGRAFNMGGGPDQSISLLELIDLIGAEQGRPPEVRFAPWRVGDQLFYVSDTSTFQAATGWAPVVRPAEGVARLHRWLAGRRGLEGRSGLALSEAI
jgi:CDP-paratose 2-epimerase